MITVRNDSFVGLNVRNHEDEHLLRGLQVPLWRGHLTLKYGRNSGHESVKIKFTALTHAVVSTHLGRCPWSGFCRCFQDRGRHCRLAAATPETWSATTEKWSTRRHFSGMPRACLRWYSEKDWTCPGWAKPCYREPPPPPWTDRLTAHTTENVPSNEKRCYARLHYCYLSFPINLIVFLVFYSLVR